MWDWDGQIKESQEECANSLRRVQHSLSTNTRSSTRGNPRTVWGQYLDDGRPSQYGIHGTAAALYVLSLDNRPQYGKLMLSGSDWLKQEMMAPSSKTKQWYPNSFYKLFSAVNALANKSHSQSEIDSMLEDLVVVRRLQSGGWGEYWPQTQSGVSWNWNQLSTALALILLSRYSGKIASVTANIWIDLHALLDASSSQAQNYLKRRGMFGRTRMLVTCALSVFAASLYPLNNELTRKRDETARLMEKILYERDVKLEMLNTEYTHEYLIPEGTHGFTSKYIVYVVHPIVASSLIVAKRLSRNMSYVLDMVETYVDEINRNGAYKSKDVGLTSVGDQAWVCLFLNKFSNLDLQLSANSIWRGKLIAWRRKHSRLLKLITLATATLGSAYLTIAPSPYSQGWGLVSAFLGGVLTSTISGR